VETERAMRIEEESGGLTPDLMVELRLSVKFKRKKKHTREGDKRSKIGKRP